MATQFLHQQRSDQAFDTAQALKLLENIVESGIAGICRARALFPEAFFKTFRTAGGVISRFDMDVLLSADAAATTTADSSLTNQWNRFRAEAIILLEWIRCGALQVMREGKLARLTFGIHLAAAQQSRTADTLVESYTFDLISCDKMNKTKKSMDKVALEASFEALVRNLDSYFATVDSTEYGLLMTQRRFFTISLDFSESILPESLPLSIHPSSSRLNVLAMEQARLLHTDDKGSDFTKTTVGQVLEPFATGLGIRISASVKGSSLDADYQAVPVHNKDDYSHADERSANCALNSSASSAIHMSPSMGEAHGIENQDSALSYHSRPCSIFEFEQQHVEDRDMHSPKDYIGSNAMDLPQANSYSVVSNQDPGPQVSHHEEQQPIQNGMSLPPSSPVSIQQDPTNFPTGSKVYAIPFGETHHRPCTILDYRFQHGDLNYKVLFTDHELIVARRKKQWLPQRSVSAEMITASVDQASKQHTNRNSHDELRYSYILKPIVVVKRRKL